jgi:hypothetical protein
MKSNARKLAVGVSVVVLMLVALVGVRLWVESRPFSLDGPEMAELYRCAEMQKHLFIRIRNILEKEGVNREEIDRDPVGQIGIQLMTCPGSWMDYRIELAAYGNPDAVLISDWEDRHPTTFRWWLMGMKPKVHTMGDGMIYFFHKNNRFAMHSLPPQRSVPRVEETEETPTAEF